LDVGVREVPSPAIEGLFKKGESNDCSPVVRRYDGDQSSKENDTSGRDNICIMVVTNSVTENAQEKGTQAKAKVAGKCKGENLAKGCVGSNVEYIDAGRVNDLYSTSLGGNAGSDRLTYVNSKVGHANDCAGLTVSANLLTERSEYTYNKRCCKGASLVPGENMRGAQRVFDLSKLLPQPEADHETKADAQSCYNTSVRRRHICSQNDTD
jgi:hypothetical protein